MHSITIDIDENTTRLVIELDNDKIYTFAGYLECECDTNFLYRQEF